MKDPGEGYSVTNDGLEWSELKYSEDRSKEADVRVAELIVGLANTLPNEVDIQMTFDTPSMNASKKMPVLDLQIWCQNNQVRFCFYEKPMASNFVIHRWSALSWTTKKSSLAGEVARRYLNNSPELVTEQYMEPLLDKFRHKMLVSGYSCREREIIIKEGTARYHNILKLAAKGERPIYRPSSWHKEERAIQKKVKGKSWFGKNDTVVFVQSTPGEVLKKGIEKIIAAKGFDVKVVEQGGRSIKSILQRSDIDPCLSCGAVDCPVCETKAGGNCQVEGVVYKIWCKKCEENGVKTVMYGETGKTARIRCGQHKAALESDRSSNLREHIFIHHPGEEDDVEFGYRVVRKYPGDPLSRQLKEAALIVNHPGISMNDKKEWVRPAHIGVRGEAI